MAETVTPSPKNTSKKLKAVLAGGVVLGVGAVVTLAAWTDQEWASGDFSSGAFNIETKTHAEEEFTSKGTADGAADIFFEMDEAKNLSPTDTVYAPLVLRLDKDTTYNADVVMNTAQLRDATTDDLTYGISQVPSPALCKADSPVIQTIVDSGTDFGESQSEGFQLTTDITNDQPGEQVTLCFEVTAGKAIKQGQKASAVWEFVGTSKPASD